MMRQRVILTTISHRAFRSRTCRLCGVGKDMFEEQQS